MQKLNYAKEEQLGSLGSPNTGIFGESGNSATLLRIKELQIGNFHLQQYPACADRIPEAVLGEDLLSQFILTLDYPGNAVALTPIARPKFEHNIFSTGICEETTVKNGLRIGGIWENSPAVKAGIRPGDLILKLNGKPAAIDTFDTLDEDDAITSCNLLIESKGVQHSITLKKAYLLPPVTQEVQQK